MRFKPAKELFDESSCEFAMSMETMNTKDYIESIAAEGMFHCICLPTEGEVKMLKAAGYGVVFLHEAAGKRYYEVSWGGKPTKYMKVQFTADCPFIDEPRNNLGEFGEDGCVCKIHRTETGRSRCNEEHPPQWCPLKEFNTRVMI